MPDYPNPVENEEEVMAKNLWVARRMLAAFAWADIELVREYISPDIINRSPHSAGTEREDDEIRVEHEIFPDIHFREEVAIAEGDMVFLGWEGTGTHLGELYGKPPTGTRIELHGGEALRFRDGMIIEHWDHYAKPRLESLALLGVLDDDALAALSAEGLV
jgi:C-1 hydroxylase